MKKMLFVDDRSKRIHGVLKKLSGMYDITIATNVKETLRLLAREEFDVVSLDHDLTGNDFEDPDSPTCGMEVVRYIEKTGWPDYKPRPEFWIHSSNIFAAHLMTVRLTAMRFDVWSRPFTYDEGELKYAQRPTNHKTA
jgi:NAD+-processing family protein with receiver domain